MKLLIHLFILTLLLLTGCNSQPKPSKGEPSWVINPNQDGKTGAIGVAGRTYDQKPSTQRKLAITRALDELTLQQGVDVNLNMSKRDVVTNSSSSMHMDSQSTYGATSKVTAHIENIWKNSYTNELYVWMVMD